MAKGNMTDQPRRAPCRQDDIVFQRLPDGTGVLVDPASGASYALNATGVEVWELCDGTHSEQEIVHALLERYEATTDEVQQSVRALITHLQALGVLEQAYSS